MTKRSPYRDVWEREHAPTEQHAEEELAALERAISSHDDSGWPHVDRDYIDVVPKRADVRFDAQRAYDGERLPNALYEDRYDQPRLAVDAGDGGGTRLDGLIDETAIIEHDGRASTRTFFYPDEATNEVRRFERMIRYQEDAWSGMKNQQRAADRERWVETFCAFCDLSSRVVKRVKLVVDEIDMSHMAHFNSQKVILGIISIVANEDRRFIRDDESFRTLLSEVGLDLKSLKTVRSMIRERSDVLDGDPNDAVGGTEP